MKVKLAVPSNVLNAHQISLLEKRLSEGLLPLVKESFPNWQDRNVIYGGEIILQDTDLTKPIAGIKPGIHVTMSLISFMPDRDFDNLASGTGDILDDTQDENGTRFMEGIGIFVQMSLDTLVKKVDAEYITHPDGRNLLEYSYTD